MIIGYVRVSTAGQNTENQRLAILEFCNKERLKVDEWIEVTASSRKDSLVRKIDDLMKRAGEGDTVIVAELSRLGRSVGQIVSLVDAMVAGKVGLICIKENIRLVGKMDIAAKVMTTMFSLMAEIERDLISERTKEGLIRARASGKRVGRPPGKYSSKLDEHGAEIIAKLKQHVPMVHVAEEFSTTPGNLRGWLKKKGLGRDGEKIE